jgi:ABC-2 type transport system permease protein
MTGYRQLLEKEVIEAWRTYRLGLTCALFIVLGILSPVIVRFLPELQQLLGNAEELGFGELDLPDVIDLLVRNLIQFGSIAAVLLAMGSVARERDRGTLPLVLSKPVSRTAVLAAKFVSIAMILGLATFLGVLAAWLYTGVLYGVTPPFGWVELAILVLLAVLVPAAIAFLGSVLVRSELGAAAFGLAGLVLLTFGSAVPTLNPALSAGLTELARAAPLEGIGEDLNPGPTIALSVGIVLASLAIAWLRFRRADL